MVLGMSGGWKTKAESRKAVSPKIEESPTVNDAIPMKMKHFNHKDSMPSPLKDEKSSTDQLACLSCLSFRGQNLSPQKKFPKLKILCGSPCRSRCLDFHNTRARGFPVLSLNLKGSMWKSRSQLIGNAGIAWMTLSGLLGDGDDVFSNEVVKLIGHRETVAWNGFAPLQKVLVLAVTAAAANSAKQRYSKELRNLQRAIDLKDKDLETLREKIGQLQEHLSFWKEEAQNLCMEAKDSGTRDKTSSAENASPLFKLGLDSTPKCEAVMLEQFDTPQVGNGLQKKPEHVACLRKNMRVTSFRKSSYISGKAMPKAKCDEDNEIRTFLDRLSEFSSLNGGQFNASTPEFPLARLDAIDTPQLPCTNVISQQRLVRKAPEVTNALTSLKQKGQLPTNENKVCGEKKDADHTMVNQLVNNTADSLLTPSCGKTESDNGWSSELVIEQLLGELESTAVKVASMEAQINFLKEKESNREDLATVLDKPTCHHTCKECNSNIKLLEDAEKKLATSREACRKKEKAISRLENENATLQEMVSQLRSIQVTPKVVTSNMLFNLDSPVKIDSPQRVRSPFSLWRRQDEVSRESTSLERKSMEGSCESDMYRSESAIDVPHTEGGDDKSGCKLQAGAMYRLDHKDHMPHTEGNKNEPACMLQAVRAIDSENITMQRGSGMEYGMERSGEEEVGCRSSSSSTDDMSRRSGTSSTRYSSDTSSSGSVANARLMPRPPRSYTSHARKLKFTNAAEFRVSGDNGQLQTAGGRRRDASGSLLNSKASNVLAGVEPNTPLRDRKLSNGSKEDKFWGHSLDNLSKAKENFTQRRRWL